MGKAGRRVLPAAGKCEEDKDRSSCLCSQIYPGLMVIHRQQLQGLMNHHNNGKLAPRKLHKAMDQPRSCHSHATPRPPAQPCSRGTRGAPDPSGSGQELEGWSGHGGRDWRVWDQPRERAMREGSGTEGRQVALSSWDERVGGTSPTCPWGRGEGNDPDSSPWQEIQWDAPGNR